MRKLAILVLLGAMVLPARTEKPVRTRRLTVEQLEQFLSAAHGLKDKELAKQIYDTRLAERLSEEKRSIFEKELPGPRSQGALTAIADESDFLDLPSAEVPSQPAPTQDEQGAILARAVDYVKSTIHRLPDLYATRMTTGFVGTTMAIPPFAHNSIPNLTMFPNDQRLSPAVKFRVVVLYRNGRDTYVNERRRVAIECDWRDAAWVSATIEDGGQFGEILAPVPEIVAQGHVSWSHWERHGESLLAVFHYAAILPFQYELKCPDVPTPPGSFEYWGEFAVNPDDGSILRITRSRRGMFDWPWLVRPEMEQTMISVSYGSVEIGERIYICPLRAVVVGLGPALDLPAEAKIFDHQFHLSEDPVLEGLSDMTFSEYHMFRSNARILPGLSQTPEMGPSNSAPANPPPSASAPREK